MKKRSARALSNKKKNRKDGGRNRNNKKLASVEDLLQAADNAMTAMDVRKAIPLYSKAVTQLRAKISPDGTDINISNADVGAAASSQSEVWQQLIQALEKLGEAQVSTGEQDQAKNNFQEAIQLLEQQKQSQNGNQTSEANPSNKNDGEDELAYHETRSSLYLYIGQLCAEQEALQTYKEGINSLEMCVRLVFEQQQQQLETKRPAHSQQGGDSVDMHDDDDENHQSMEEYYRRLLPELQRKLAGAYCTVAELYLTDLCYEDNAESECENYLQRALQIQVENGRPIVDALQTMASLRLSQDIGRRKEAVSYILQTYETMRKGSEALAALVGISVPENYSTEINDVAAQQPEGQALELKEVDAATNLPEFEFRCQTAKILLECAGLLRGENEETKTDVSRKQEHECINAAISVLGSLLAQNDEVVETWYLMGCAYTLATIPGAAAAARHYLLRAKEMLLQIQKSLQQEAQYSSSMDDGEEIQIELTNNASQVQDVQTKLDELGDDGQESDDDDMYATDKMEE